MIDEAELDAAIAALQAGGDSDTARLGFAMIARAAQRDSAECASLLARAALAETASGRVPTPRLLTLLALTGEPAPALVPHCLQFLHEGLRHAATMPPSDALLGAAAIVARTHTRALLPDVEALKENPRAAPAAQAEAAQRLLSLLAITARTLHALPDHPVTTMARTLWHRAALLDLESVADFVGFYLEQERSAAAPTQSDDPVVALLVDLVDRVPAGVAAKRYAGQSLEAAGVSQDALARLAAAWRAVVVAPPQASSRDCCDIADSEAPLPDPRTDECLTAFTEGDENGVEVARVALEQMIEMPNAGASMHWWLVLTVDAVPARRRRREICWALRLLATSMRSGRPFRLPLSILCRWVEAPQLLDTGTALISLELLARERATLVVDRWLYRAVAASDSGTTDARVADITVGGLWRALAAAAPAALGDLVARWDEQGFRAAGFIELLRELGVAGARPQA